MRELQRAGIAETEGGKVKTEQDKADEKMVAGALDAMWRLGLKGFTFHVEQNGDQIMAVSIRNQAGEQVRKWELA